MKNEQGDNVSPMNLMTKRERIESQIQKMIEQKSRLSIFDGINYLYLHSRGVGHTFATIEGIRHFHQYYPESHVILIISEEKQRHEFFKQLCDMGQKICIITIEQIREMRDVRSLRGVIFWDNFAIIRLANEVSLVKNNLTILERLRNENVHKD